MDNISRYSSSPNQDYGHGSASQTWSPSNSSNGSGSLDVMGKSVNHPSLSPSLSNRSFLPQQREMGSVGGEGFANGNRGNGSQGFASGNGIQHSGFPKGRNTSLLYDTGEPLGSLSSSIADAVKTKLIPTREEMKDKLVHALSSDSNIGILPGYKSNGFPAAGFHGLRNTQSTPFLRSEGFQTDSQQRVPSPVARAQAAIGRSRLEIGAAKDILQGNNSRISGIYRHPRGDPWVNASTPGTGGDSVSVRKLKQDSYRRDLETQMEQSRLRKEVELKKDREGLEHPLGTRYNSHSIYTLSKEEPHAMDKSSTSKYSNHLPGKTNSIGQRALGSPPRKGDADLSPRQTGGRSPWLDQLASTPFARPQGQSQLPAAHPMGTSNLAQGPANTAYPLPPQQQTYPTANPYYPPPQLPMYPYPYAFPPQPPPQMPYPVYPAPGPTQMPQFPSMPQQPRVSQNPQFIPSPENPMRAQRFEDPQPSPRHSIPSFDQQLQRERLLLGNSNSQNGGLNDFITGSDCEEEMEAALRQHVWQTSDQLASDDLKKALFQNVLKKQILQKQLATEVERKKEEAENVKLEKSIQDYQEKMRKQFETEQLIIKRKMAGNVGDSPSERGNWSQDNTPKERPSRPEPHHPPKPDSPVKETVSEQAIVPANQYDEKPCKIFMKVEVEKGGGDSGERRCDLPLPIPPVESNPDAEDNSRGETPLVSRSISLLAISLTVSGRTDDDAMENNVALTRPEDSPMTSEENDDSTGVDENDLKALTHIQNALAVEIRRMEILRKKQLEVGRRR